MNSEEAMDQATKKKVAASLRSAAAKLLARAKSPEQAASELKLDSSFINRITLEVFDVPYDDMAHWVANSRGRPPMLSGIIAKVFRKGYEEGYKAGLADGASEEKFQR